MTVDWVVLTAVLVTLGLASALLWRETAGKLATDVASTTTDYSIATTFD